MFMNAIIEKHSAITKIKAINSFNLMFVNFFSLIDFKPPDLIFFIRGRDAFILPSPAGTTS